jgi:hypothetical protein
MKGEDENSSYDILFGIIILLLLPLALQPAVGFGLSSNILLFFSYLSPTLSIIIKSIQLFPLFDFRNISSGLEPTIN